MTNDWEELQNLQDQVVTLQKTFLSLKEYKSWSTAKVYAVFSNHEKHLTRNRKFYDGLLDAYKSVAKSFVVEGKTGKQRLQEFVAEFNEFPTLTRLSKDLEDGPKKLEAPAPPPVPGEILSVEELTEISARGCGDPSCEHDHSDVPLIFNPCHPGGLFASYWRGVVQLKCTLCGTIVANIKVADKSKEF